MMGRIYSHDYNVLERLKFQGSPRGEVFFGVELEVSVVEAPDPYCECPGCKNKRAAWGKVSKVPPRDKQTLVDFCMEGTLKDFVVTKHDGSVKNGFELVSAPASLLIHRRRWVEFWKEFPKEFIADPSCGMHVHISKAPLTSEQIGVMHTFLNSMENRKFVELIAGRTANKYTTYIEKTPSRLEEIGKGETVLPGRFPAGKYEALNVLPKNTVEVRIFASTVDFSTFMKNLEFSAALAHWVRNDKGVEIGKCGVERFREWVEERERYYPELVEFLEQHL